MQILIWGLDEKSGRISGESDSLSDRKRGLRTSTNREGGYTCRAEGKPEDERLGFARGGPWGPE